MIEILTVPALSRASYKRSYIQCCIWIKTIQTSVKIMGELTYLHKEVLLLCQFGSHILAPWVYRGSQHASFVNENGEPIRVQNGTRLL